MKQLLKELTTQLVITTILFASDKISRLFLRSK